MNSLYVPFTIMFMRDFVYGRAPMRVEEMISDTGTEILTREVPKVVEYFEYPITEENQCTTDEVTYILELKIHAQKTVIEAIQAVQNSKDPEVLFDLPGSAEVYFGALADQINQYLFPLKVQVHINLDALVVEDFMTDLSFDKSCEIGNSMLDRTINAANLLRHKYNHSVGLHLFVWACPRDPIEYADWHIEKNEHCGRVMGQLWLGTINTMPKLASLVLKSIRREIEYIDNEKTFSSDICNYVGKCVARNLTDLGQKIFGEVNLSYDSHFEYENEI